MSDERFYEDDNRDLPQDEQDYDQQDDRQQPQGDEPMDQLERLLLYLGKMFESASPVPLSNKRMVNADMCLRIIDNIYNCLPVAVRQAQQILDNRDRIIHDAEVEADAKVRAADARADAAIKDATQTAQRTIHDAEDKAEETIHQAEMRARAMVEQSEIMRHAHEEAAQLMNDTRVDVNQQKMEANQYVEDLLHELERDVQSTLAAVQSSLKNIAGN